MSNQKNGYIAFYNDQRIELYAESLYDAKQKAIMFFMPPKSKHHMVHVYLAEIDGKVVTHTPDF